MTITDLTLKHCTYLEQPLLVWALILGELASAYEYGLIGRFLFRIGLDARRDGQRLGSGS